MPSNAEPQREMLSLVTSRIRDAYLRRPFYVDGDTDLVTVLEEHPDDSQRSAVQAAVTYCPAMALAIEEEA